MTRPPDPAMIRASLGSFLRAQRVDYLPNSVGHAAAQSLGVAIGAWVDGLEEEARPVVAKARDWLRDSTDRDERFGAPPASFAARRARALAVADWLIENAQPASRYAASWRLSTVALGELERSTAAPQGYLVEELLPDHLLDCFSAREFLVGWTTYRRLGGREIDRVEQATSPTELAAALCREHHDAGGGHPSSWAGSGRRVLAEMLSGWLDRGQEVRAASWLKAVFWDSAAAATPAEALAIGRVIRDEDRPSQSAGQ